MRIIWQAAVILALKTKSAEIVLTKTKLALLYKM